jgi:anti-anti-sigma regulatory factor
VSAVADVRLQCQVRWDGGLMHLSPVGDLRLQTVALLRTVVLKGIAQEPSGIIFDLSGVVDFDDDVLTVFPALARAAAAWPGIRLVAHSAPPVLLSRMQALAVTRTVTVVDDETAAVRLAATGTGPTLVRFALDNGADDLAEVRHIVRQACRRAGWSNAADPAEVVAGELVTNALRHADGPRNLTVSTTSSHVHVAVHDQSPAEPFVRDLDRQRPDGRGMVIVDALSTSWGSTPTAGGKVVWATIRPLTASDSRH